MKLTGPYIERLHAPTLVALLLIAIGSTGDVLAQRVVATRAFDDGTRLLASGDFRGAVDAFQRAEETGLVSGPLYYNRGIAHYRLDEIGQSIRYFERAARLMDDQTRVRHSLGIAGIRQTDTFSELPIPIWKRFQRAVISVVSVPTLMIAGLAAYILLCGGVLFHILGYWDGPWFRRVRLAGVVVSVVLLTAAFSSSIWPAYPAEAVILADEAVLHDQPDAESENLEEIHEGLVVGIIAEGGEWSLVQLPNGVRGWILAAELGLI